MEKELGSRIKELRETKELSQIKLAKLLSVSRETISKWELNKRQPSIQSIQKICVLFGISADDFLEIETEKQRNEIRINNSFNNNNGTINFNNKN